MDGEPSALERILRRDRQIVVGGLVFVSLASWLYILTGAATDMGEIASAPDGITGAMRFAWTPAHLGLMLAMWWVMMVAMMLPSAAPMVLLFATVNRKSRQQDRPYVPTGFFAAGYLVAWGGFSLIAVLLQWGLERLSLLSPTLHVVGLDLGAALLIGARIYQLTPLKHACLRHCRSPIDFIALLPHYATIPVSPDSGTPMDLSEVDSRLLRRSGQALLAAYRFEADLSKSSTVRLIASRSGGALSGCLLRCSVVFLRSSALGRWRGSPRLRFIVTLQ
jgi:predicted metal-binding integral membrane protein DUF2182